MRTKSLWSILLAGALFIPLSLQAADNAGDWADGWVYFENDADANEQVASTSSSPDICAYGINHYGSPCDCAPSMPDYEFEGECSNPY